MTCGAASDVFVVNVNDGRRNGCPEYLSYFTYVTFLYLSTGSQSRESTGSRVALGTPGSPTSSHSTQVFSATENTWSSGVVM